MIAVHKNLNFDESNIISNARSAGFKDIKIIDEREAKISALNALKISGKILICEIENLQTEITIYENNKILENVINKNICENKFNEMFNEFLNLRFSRKISKEVSEQIRIILNDQEYFNYMSVRICREDFERLIYFKILELIHIIKRLIKIYNPDKFIITGEACKIPLIIKTFLSKINLNPEFIDDIILQGASKIAGNVNEKIDPENKLNELRNEIIYIESYLNRHQKDRIYKIFKHVESNPEPEILKMFSDLIQDIKNLRDDAF